MGAAVRSGRSTTGISATMVAAAATAAAADEHAEQPTVQRVQQLSAEPAVVGSGTTDHTE